MAGLMGLTESGIFNNITVKKANIKGTSNYTGGVIGRITSKIYYNIGDITVTDSKIQGVNYTGGVIGNGRGRNLTVQNSEIQGNTYVGGAIGVLDYNSSDNRAYLVQDCTITGTGSYIGGVTGQSNEMYGAFSVNNEVIGKGTNAVSVGGISGINYNSMRESASIDTKISVQGRNAGGIVRIFTRKYILFLFL